MGWVGELHPAEAIRLELTHPCVLSELDLTLIMTYRPQSRLAVAAPTRFPAVRRDVALVVDRDLPAVNVTVAVRETGSQWLESVDVFDVYEGESIAPGKKSVALACRYRARDRTLTDEEVNRAHAQLVGAVRRRLGAELRQ